MIVPFRVGDAELIAHDVKEWPDRQIHTCRPEIVCDVKSGLVASRIMPRRQPGLIDNPARANHAARDPRALAAERENLDLHSHGGAAARSIDHMDGDAVRCHWLHTPVRREPWASLPAGGYEQRV